MSTVAVIKLGVVGCGAVSELFHIPIALACDDVELTMLVDKNLKRAEAMGSKFGIENLTHSYETAIGKIDAAIVAVPHHLHSAVATGLLAHGIHVLVEKPMALSMAECEAMISGAKRTGAILAVGLVRRYLYSHQLLRELISQGFLGKIETFDVREGQVFGWPAVSDAFFRRETGGGVLADIGAHVLDSVLWWLGDYESFEYHDDNMGGVEAECSIHLRMRSGAVGFVELSRTRNLRNTAILQGEKATLEVQTLGSRISFRPKGSSIRVIGEALESIKPIAMEFGRTQSVDDLMKAQLKDWIEAIRCRGKPYVTGEEASRSVALIEACHENRQPLQMPWVRPIQMPSSLLDRGNLRGKKVFVTGATGFIGGRLVESLVMDHGADVHVLVRNLAKTPRIARFPVTMVHGDLMDLGLVSRAMDGCEILFHCAYGNMGSPEEQREVNVKGTENALSAASGNNLRRVVHVSTLSVYGRTEDSDLDETAPRMYSNQVYADSKLEAERLAFQYFERYDLPVSIIQPAIVYGPFGKYWTVELVNQLKAGRVVLVDGGEGLCNAVYVDDAVQAIILAATEDSAIGQAFLISAESPVTWRDYYGAYRKMLGIESTSLSEAEASEEEARYYRARTRARIDKAKKMLGYKPAYDLEHGMELTEKWLRFANLI